MTFDKQGNLFCNWCGETVIPAGSVTEHDKEFNTGYTKCSTCIDKSTPYPDSGNINDLPDDFNPMIFKMEKPRRVEVKKCVKKI